VRVGDIIGMIALAIIIIAAVLIVANFQSAVGSLHLTGSANTTATNVFTNVWTGLQLAAIGIIITAAVGLIALVLGSFCSSSKTRHINQTAKN
jgi:uncharacterized metal-binding protein